MTFSPRPYQSAATDAAKDWLRASVEPCLIDAAPAAGKSFMVAIMAQWFREISAGKRVLCLQPNAKLVKQNVEKFRMTGEQCSIFSASAGSKSTRHGVVFATPLTVKNAISRFTKDFCAIILDEAHGLTPTILAIIEEMRKHNPNLRILGLTGTPYCMGTGYIYRMGPDGRVNGDDTCRNPFFVKCVYRVSAQEMLEAKFITPMEVVAINAKEYDTSGITLLPNGALNHSTVEQAFEGHGRRTAAIVADVISQVNERGLKGGVMLFAATVRHAEEIMASLPPGNSAMSTGDKCSMMGKEATSDQVVKAYKAGAFRYLVSVGQLTTGFDVSHTVFIATLRYTESANLITQILGRAWRLDDDKPVCYWADYAGNCDRHFPDGDIYSPEIKTSKEAGEGVPIEAECPDCGYVNEFNLQPDYAEYQRDSHGYALDVFGAQLMGEFGPIPVHYGRRCMGLVKSGRQGLYDRCGFRWNSKPCLQCNEPVDIAARHCDQCGAECVDPNEKLTIDFVAKKKDVTQPQTERVVSLEVKESVSQKGNATIRADFVTHFRQFSCWYMAEPRNAKQASDLAKFQEATRDGAPETVSYVRDVDSSFFRVLSFNKPSDDEDIPAHLLERKEIAKLRKYG